MLHDTESASGGVDSNHTVLRGAVKVIKPIHDRMPVILPREAAMAWLTPGPMSLVEVSRYCQSYPAEEMRAQEVSRIVNNARNDVPECVLPLQDV